MRGQAMTKVCKRLQANGIDLSGLDALEFFAREGDWQTQSYAHLVKSVTAWEIDPAFEENLKKNLPEAQIVIGNSFELAKQPENQGRFSLLVFDNPQGLYGEYCEHFEAIRLAKGLMKETAFVVFNINRAPFNYSEHPKWQARRNAFYKCHDCSKLTGDYMLAHYHMFFKQMGLTVKDAFEQKRNEDYLSYLVFQLNKGSA